MLQISSLSLLLQLSFSSYMSSTNGKQRPIQPFLFFQVGLIMVTPAWLSLSVLCFLLLSVTSFTLIFFDYFMELAVQLLIEKMFKVSNNSALIAWQAMSHIATYNFEQGLSSKINTFLRSLQKLMNILHQAKTTRDGQ